MTLREHLDLFYQTYNIPPEGGVSDKTFEVPLPFFKLTLPNFSWRKRMLYVHDLEHILNQQDTTWKGEIFIATWEISTGFFKNFPVILFPLWTMGWGLWFQPATVFRSFSKGYNDKGIARLDFNREKLLELDLAKLKSLTMNMRPDRSRLLLYFRFMSWCIVSQFVFLFPALIVAILVVMLLHY